MMKKLKRILFGLILIAAGGSGYLFYTKNKSNTNTGIIQPVNNHSRSTSTMPIIPTNTPTPLPSKKTIGGGKQVFQTFNNCGPASLSMALSYFGIQVNQETLGNELRPYQHPEGNNDDKSVTLPELSKKAKEYGFLTYHRPAGNIDIIQKFIAEEIPVITRTWLKPNEDIGHYRVVKGYNQKRGILIQDDSLQGKNKTYSYQKFNQIWQAFNFEFLVLVPPQKQAQAEQILGNLVDEKTAWKQALETAQIQSNQNPESIYADYNRLTANYYLGNYRQVVDIFIQIQSQLPRRMLWYQIEPILAYYQLEDYDKVMELTQKVFDSQNRAFSELHYLRGKIYQKRDQDSLAEEEYRLVDKYNQSEYWKINLKEII